MNAVETRIAEETKAINSKYTEMMKAHNLRCWMAANAGDAKYEEAKAAFLKVKAEYEALTGYSYFLT